MLDTHNGSCLAAERTTVAKKSAQKPSHIKPKRNEVVSSQYKSSVSQTETQDCDSVPEPEWRGGVECILRKHFERLIPFDKEKLESFVEFVTDDIVDLIESDRGCAVMISTPDQVQPSSR